MNPVARVLHKLGHLRWWSLLMSRILPPTDRLVRRLTGGRFDVTSIAYPTLVLHSTGHRSGQHRTTTLMYVRDDVGNVELAGTNFGQAHHPAWSTNLLSDPDVEIELRPGEREAVRAEPIDDPVARRDVWDRFEAMYPPYRTYQEVAGRDIRLFRMVPRDQA